MPSISPRVIRRVSFYYEALLKLNLAADDYVSSKKIEEMTGISSNQVRQDFFALGITIGRQKKGYQAGVLQNEIKRVLSIDHCSEVVVVGAGRLGRALAEYPLFWVRNIRVVALFDVDSSLFNRSVTIHGQNIPILPVDGMETFFRQRPCVSVALLTVPEKEAQGALENLLRLGIKGVINFAPRILKQPKGSRKIHLVNECVGSSLYKTVYQIFQDQEEK